MTDAPTVEKALDSKPAEPIIPFMRRMEVPDIDRHGEWFIPRLLKEFPHFNVRQARTWLMNIMYAPEVNFLFFEHGLAFAQTVHYDQLTPEPIVMEQFVWAEDPSNPAHVEAVSHAYTHFTEWAKRKGLGTVIVGERTDVPKEMIAKRVSQRLFETKRAFIRVSKVN